MYINETETKIELQELFLEIREEIVEGIIPKMVILLSGKLLEIFDAFTEKTDVYEDDKISECIGNHFWDQFWKDYPKYSRYMINFDSKRKKIYVLDITIKEASRRTEVFINLMQGHIDKLVDLAVERKLQTISENKEF